MGRPPESVSGPARKAALAKALELDETLPEAHHALASQAVTDWDWAAAERSFRRAIDVNPSYAEARADYSHFLSFMRRPDEAMMQIERAIELDPLNPLIRNIYGQILRRADRDEEAIVQFRNVLRTAPNSGPARAGLEGALYSLGRYEESLAVRRQMAMASGERELDEALALGYGEGGYQGAMRRVLAVAEERTRDGRLREVPIGMAALYQRIGEHEPALGWLERAYERRSPALPDAINNSHDFDPLRNHPRFQALLRKMNLPM